MTDLLDMERINGLPHPLIAEFLGGDRWEVESVDVETGLMRILVCGLLEVKHFGDVSTLIDADGQRTDADDLYLEEGCADAREES